MTTVKKTSKFLSRRWVHTQEVFLSALILALVGKLSWEWVTVVSIAFWGYGIFDAIVRVFTDVGTISTKLLKNLSKDEALEVIEKLTKGRDNVD